MTTKMLKVHVAAMTIFMIYLTGVWAVAVPTEDKVGHKVKPESSSSSSNLDFTKLTAQLRVVKYTGPRYNCSEADKASLRVARETGGNWDKPKDMPVIDLEAGTLLDVGVYSKGHPDFGTLSGNHYIAAYEGYNCPANLVLASVSNFGCGTGCYNLHGSSAVSGLVQQQYHGNPYPTMDVWAGQGCQGKKLAHFGVDQTSSCTNLKSGQTYQSFIGWFNC